MEAQRGVCAKPDGLGGKAGRRPTNRRKCPAVLVAGDRGYRATRRGAMLPPWPPWSWQLVALPSVLASRTSLDFAGSIPGKLASNALLKRQFLGNVPETSAFPVCSNPSMLIGSQSSAHEAHRLISD
jgi:hypothetical protein